MQRSALRLVPRLALFLLPAFCLLAAYLVLDPFRVVRNHATFYDPTDLTETNRDFVSTELFLRRPAPDAFDSFVLGNSRSLAFTSADWKAHLPGARPFHFDATQETLFGIWGKLRLIDEEGVRVKNALVVLDADVLEGTENRLGHLFIKHPRVSHGSRIEFHQAFVRAFFTNFFFVKYADYRLFGKLRPYMADVKVDGSYRHLPETNDFLFEAPQREMERVGEDRYYEQRRPIFYTRNVTGPGRRLLNARAIAMLNDIQHILSTDGARYHVILSPLYDQVPTHPEDLAMLRQIFGAERVVDFSGKNDLTDNMRNFYEPYHFRVEAGREMLARIYRPRPPQ